MNENEEKRIGELLEEFVKIATGKDVHIAVGVRIDYEINRSGQIKFTVMFDSFPKQR